jgi:hypothetical protein
MLLLRQEKQTIFVSNAATAYVTCWQTAILRPHLLYLHVILCQRPTRMIHMGMTVQEQNMYILWEEWSPQISTPITVTHLTYGISTFNTVISIQLHCEKRIELSVLSKFHRIPLYETLYTGLLMVHSKSWHM